MSNTCAQPVDTGWTSRGKDCVRLYTVLLAPIVLLRQLWVQVAYSTQSLHQMYSDLCTGLFNLSPLVEYILYPQSTAPTIRTTNLNYLKRNNI